MFDASDDGRPAVLSVRLICGKVEEDDVAWKVAAAGNSEHMHRVLHPSTWEWMTCIGGFSDTIQLAKLAGGGHPDRFDSCNTDVEYGRFMVLRRRAHEPSKSLLPEGLVATSTHTGYGIKEI